MVGGLFCCFKRSLLIVWYMTISRTPALRGFWISLWIKMSEIGQKNPKMDILIQRLIQDPLKIRVLETVMYQTIKKDLLKQQNSPPTTLL